MSMYDIFAPSSTAATTPAAAPASGGMNQAGALAAVGAAGGAINAYTDRKAKERMLQQQLEQMRQQIAFQERVRAEQKVLSDAEVQRQQIMARVGGDAFAGSLGQFQGSAEGQIGDKTAEISALFRDYMSRAPMPVSSAPEATGPTADREASMRQQASADVGADTNRLAAVQAYGDVMADKGRVMAQNDQLGALIRNFAAGSQGASNTEVAARAGNFAPLQAVAPAPSMLGDLFVGGSMLASKFMQPTAPSPYGLNFPAATGSLSGFRQGGPTDGFNTAKLGIGSARN